MEYQEQISCSIFAKKKWNSDELSKGVVPFLTAALRRGGQLLLDELGSPIGQYEDSTHRMRLLLNVIKLLSAQPPAAVKPQDFFTEQNKAKDQEIQRALQEMRELGLSEEKSKEILSKYIGIDEWDQWAN